MYEEDDWFLLDGLLHDLPNDSPSVAFGTCIAICIIVPEAGSRPVCTFLPWYL